MERITETITMKLHIGSGKYSLDGFINIDVQPFPNVHEVGNFREMVFSDVDEIVARHILEHFGREESLLVLRQWLSWLKPGGTLTIETPDFEYLCAQFNKDPEWMGIHAYGSQEAEWAYHKSAWYEKKVYAVAEKLGVYVVSVRHTKSRVIREERHILPNIVFVLKKP